MLCSMTGFGVVEATLPVENKNNQGVVSISLELKTLNSRFFETTCKLPGTLNALEGKVTSLLRKRLLRGRVFLSVRTNDPAQSLERQVFSESMAQMYIDSAAIAREKFNVPGELAVDNLLRLPNVFSIERASIGTQGEQAFLSSVERVLEAAMDARKKEGEFIKGDLGGHLGTCKEIIEVVFARNCVMIDEIKAQMEELKAQQDESEEHDNRMDEIQRQLDKIDVHEEISRFKSHLAAAMDVLNSSVPEKGKKLDFIAQELFREVNTLAAKSADYEISALVVDVKVALEKLREQAQNVV